MPLLTKERPIEGSTAEVECHFKNTNGTLINSDAITSISWTLTDSSRNVVNGKEDIIVDQIENPLTIVLTGDDLPADKLTFTVFVIYDSLIGTGLNLVDSVSFYVQDIANM